MTIIYQRTRNVLKYQLLWMIDTDLTNLNENGYRRRLHKACMSILRIQQLTTIIIQSSDTEDY